MQYIYDIESKKAAKERIDAYQNLITSIKKTEEKKESKEK